MVWSQVIIHAMKVLYFSAISQILKAFEKDIYLKKKWQGI